MSRPIEGEPNPILGAAESIINEARDLNRTYPTTLKFRTAEIFRNEVATFTAARRGLRNIISMIYEMNGKPYVAAFKSELNQNTENYYLIEGDKVTKQQGDKVYLFK
jgi:hypothetical protein